MKVKQFRGPFATSYEIEEYFATGTHFLQIGLQAPHRQPIKYAYLRTPSGAALLPDVAIKIGSEEEKTYRINDKCILEFDNIYTGYIRIRFLRDLPAEASIEITYDEDTD